MHLTTNGTLLDAERLALLEGVPVATFIVSLPAASARICERVSGHHRFEIVVSNLRRLRGRQHAFEQRRPLLQQRFVLRRAKPEELPALLDLAAERRARLQRVPLERDQHNAAEALSQRQATLERAVEPLDALGDTWQRHERTVHQLRSVRRALELQQPHQNRV